MGQALVEFALVVPIVVLLLAAIVQFAFIFERQIGIENAVREAARSAAALPIDGNTTAGFNADWAFHRLIDSGGLLDSNVQDYDSLDVQGLSVCFDNGATTPSGSTQILVTVSVGYTHPLFVPIISGILDGIDGSNDGALRIDTSSVFHVENPEDSSVSLVGQVCNS